MKLFEGHKYSSIFSVIFVKMCKSYHNWISNRRPNKRFISVQNSTTKLEHEASTSKIGEEQIFYFLQRGITLEKAVELMVSGFCREIFTKLPLEFAAEADKLLTLKLEGSVG